MCAIILRSTLSATPTGEEVSRLSCELIIGLMLGEDHVKAFGPQSLDLDENVLAPTKNVPAALHLHRHLFGEIVDGPGHAKLTDFMAGKGHILDPAPVRHL